MKKVRELKRRTRKKERTREERWLRIRAKKILTREGGRHEGNRSGIKTRNKKDSEEKMEQVKSKEV